MLNIYIMRDTYCLYRHEGLVKLALSTLIAFSAGTLAPAAEPEDSPLYVRSLQGAFADMTARDHGITRVQNGATQAPVGSGAVIVVDGTQWYNGSAIEWAGSLGTRLTNAKNTSPVPAQTYWDPSCDATHCGSCLPTRSGLPTCVQTCVDPGPTCLYQTCMGGSTCNEVTCTPPPTCYIQTCATDPTCQGPTCTGTCVPANCPTALSDVSVPEAGQIQLSFNSSAQLKYVLQYCTNLSAASWAEACSTNGNGGVLTLCHTNGAAFSVYRLLIQTH